MLSVFFFGYILAHKVDVKKFVNVEYFHDFLFDSVAESIPLLGRLHLGSISFKNGRVPVFYIQTYLELCCPQNESNHQLVEDIMSKFLSFQVNQID